MTNAEYARLRAQITGTDVSDAPARDRAIHAQLVQLFADHDALRAEVARLRAVADAARKLAASREKHRPHTSDCNVDWNDEPCNCALPELRAALSALDAGEVPHADETEAG